MKRWVIDTRAAIGLVVATSLLLTSNQTALAAPSPTRTVATDISASFGRSPVSVPPSPTEFLLSPDTGTVAPVNEGGLSIWLNVEPGVSYAARTLAPGINQQFVHIAQSSATTNFTFTLTRADYTIRRGPAESALVYDASSRLQAAIPPPVAVDAAGKSVPAHYEFPSGGNKLVKVVEHQDANVAYPVVADPVQILFVIAGAWILFKCAVNGGKEAKSLQGQKWYKVLWGVSWICVTGAI